MADPHRQVEHSRTDSPMEDGDGDEWPAYSLPEAASADVGAMTEVASAADALANVSARATAKAHLALVDPLSGPDALSAYNPQPMSTLAAKWPGFYPEFATRSALFGCARSGTGPSSSIREIKIAGKKDKVVRLTCSGPVLTMADKDVWEIALDIAREREAPYGATFEASLGEFAKRMGLKSSGPVAAKIRASLDRLAACELELVDDEARAKGRMIARVDGSGHALRIELDPALIEPALCGVKLFKLDSARRRALRKSSLAKWLHDFLSTHSKARAFTLGHLRGMCGYAGRPADFPAALRSALDEIQALGATEETRPLAKARSFDDATKSSDEWKLSYELGAEKPKFKVPPKPREPRVRL